MDEREDPFGVPAAAYIMDTELAATRRATHTKRWVQMIVWGGLYGGIGLTIRLAGEEGLARWFAVALLGAVAVGFAALLLATRGFSDPHSGGRWILSLMFLALVVALAVAVLLLPETARPAGIPVIWFGVLVSVVIVSVWTAMGGLVTRDPMLALIAIAPLATAVIVYLLLVLYPTSRPAAIATIVAGALAIVAAFPIRRYEMRRWRADPAIR